MHTRVLIGLALFAWPTPVAAEKRDPREQLALEVAVVAAHEGALDTIEDTALVWQVVSYRANTTQSRISFLRSHSPRALGIEACNDKNCVWSVELLNNPEVPPASISKKWWEKVRADRWWSVWNYARDLVFEFTYAQPCYGDPYTWGGAMDVEGAYKERNLIPLGCVGVQNEGFTHAPRMLSARTGVISAKDAARIRSRKGKHERRKQTEGLLVPSVGLPSDRRPGTS